MSEENDLMRPLEDFFSSPENEGYAVDIIDNTALTPAQRRKLAENVAINYLMGSQCFVCRGEFDAQGTLESICLGPIDQEDMAFAHRECFAERMEEHPKVKPLLHGNWEDFDETARNTWKEAFSPDPIDDFLIFRLG